MAKQASRSTGATASNAWRARVSPVPADRLAGRHAPAAQPPHGCSDTDLFSDALDAYSAMLGQAAQHLREAREADPATRQADAWPALRQIAGGIDSARAYLAAGDGASIVAGTAHPAVLEACDHALALYVEQLQASAEMLLACEFGDTVLNELDTALLALARRMDPLFDAAWNLRERLAPGGHP